MNLFEKKAFSIEDFIDEETGEIKPEYFEKVEELENSYDYFCNEYKELIIKSDACSAEAKKLSDRAKGYENKAKNIARYLQAVLDGETFESATNKIGYRKSETVEFDDATKFIEWAKTNALDLVKSTIEFTANKADIKKAIKEGRELQHVALVEHNNIQIK